MVLHGRVSLMILPLTQYKMFATLDFFETIFFFFFFAYIYTHLKKCPTYQPSLKILGR